jgi:hypothetical protein
VTARVGVLQRRGAAAPGVSSFAIINSTTLNPRGGFRRPRRASRRRIRNLHCRFFSCYYYHSGIRKNPGFRWFRDILMGAPRQRGVAPGASYFAIINSTTLNPRGGFRRPRRAPRRRIRNLSCRFFSCLLLPFGYSKKPGFRLFRDILMGAPQRRGAAASGVSSFAIINSTTLNPRGEFRRPRRASRPRIRNLNQETYSSDNQVDSTISYVGRSNGWASPRKRRVRNSNEMRWFRGPRRAPRPRIWNLNRKMYSSSNQVNSTMHPEIQSFPRVSCVGGRHSGGA